MRRLRAALRRWLGVDTEILTLAEQNGKLAAALHAIVAQLNSNTTTIMRWSKESATLEAIERRHAMKLGTVSNGNGHSRILIEP